MKPISIGSPCVVHLKFLGRRAVLRAGGRELQRAVGQLQLHRARPLGGDRRDPVDRLGEVACSRPPAPCRCRSGSPARNPGRCRRSASRSAVAASKAKRILVSDSATSTSSLASSISLRSSATVLRGTMTPGMPAGASRQRHLDARQPMAVGGDGAQHLARRRCRRMQVDAVQVVARLLGRDREARAVDEAAQLAAASWKRYGSSPAVMTGKSSSGRQARVKRERPQRSVSRLAAAGGVELDLRRPRAACGRCRRACAPARWWRRPSPTSAGDRSRRLSRSMSVAVSAQLAVVGLDQHVGEDRDGVAPLDHALHMAERLQEGGAFDGELHGVTILNDGFLGVWVTGRRTACGGRLPARSTDRRAGDAHRADHEV